jgi:hypothetical protein
MAAQEPHLREPKSIDDLLQKRRPDEYRALKNHEYYLVANKYGSARNRKFFIGETFSFFNSDKVRFSGELAGVTDSTFTLFYFDETEQRNLHRLFYLTEVAMVLKRDVKPGITYKASPVILLPFALDWIYFKRPPWQSPGSIALLAGIEAARVVLTNRDKLANRMKIGEKYRLVVFQY